jgi:hypothetical protein
VRVSCPLKRSDMATSHPLFYKPEQEYWSSYTGPVRRALAAVEGLKVIPPKNPLDVFALTWEFNGKLARTGVCYSDYPDLGIWRDVEGLDAIFKMKHHPDRTEGQVDVPVFAGGFCLAVGAGGGDTGKFLEDLEELRRQKDNLPQARGPYFNKGFFREFAVPLLNRQEWGRYFNEEHGWAPQGNFLEALMTHACMLNVCGHGNSIDRKVVEACALGVIMISDRGLESLALPWGERFVHGRNIWFVDSPEEAARAPEEMTPADVVVLRDGARDLFDKCFAPKPMGHWYLRCAHEVAHG